MFTIVTGQLPQLKVTELPRETSNALSTSVGDVSTITNSASPLRGKEMKQNLLSKLRSPPLIHAWEFWHDRQDRSKTETPIDRNSAVSKSSETDSGTYEDRLVQLSSITDIRSFWSTYNNFDISSLALRDSVHLFHKDIKPVWEDARNEHGGSWTFRVPKDKAGDFWKEMCMLAIGERLQQAVESSRTKFRDDICGITLSVRFTSILVQVWNRDAQHDEGVQGILAAILEEMPEGLKPREGSYYYKKHSEHASFGQ